jgi:hypothetical protein
MTPAKVNKNGKILMIKKRLATLQTNLFSAVCNLQYGPSDEALKFMRNPTELLPALSIIQKQIISSKWHPPVSIHYPPESVRVAKCFFSNQKSQFGKTLVGLRLENVDVFYGHSEYFRDI